ELGPIDPTALFPLDDRVRVFDTRQGPGGPGDEGVIAFEVAPIGMEGLSDGRYVIYETRVLTRSTGARRVVSREWLRRAPEGILCARRDEGPLACALVPPQPVILSRLAIGQSWTWSGMAGGRRSEMRSTVAALERVSVAAGTFRDAWRIDSEIRSGDGHPDTIRRTCWFEPG